MKEEKGEIVETSENLGSCLKSQKNCVSLEGNITALKKKEWGVKSFLTSVLEVQIRKRCHTVLP